MKQEPLIEPIMEAEKVIITDEILKKYELSIDETKIDVFDNINFVSILEE